MQLENRLVDDPESGDVEFTEHTVTVAESDVCSKERCAVVDGRVAECACGQAVQCRFLRHPCTGSANFRTSRVEKGNSPSRTILTGWTPRRTRIREPAGSSVIR
jgi:hypothetical protein